MVEKSLNALAHKERTSRIKEDNQRLYDRLTNIKERKDEFSRNSMFYSWKEHTPIYYPSNKIIESVRNNGQRGIVNQNKRLEELLKKKKNDNEEETKKEKGSTSYSELLSFYDRASTYNKNHKITSKLKPISDPRKENSRNETLDALERENTMKYNIAITELLEKKRKLYITKLKEEQVLIEKIEQEYQRRISLPPPGYHKKYRKRRKKVRPNTDDNTSFDTESTST